MRNKHGRLLAVVRASKSRRIATRKWATLASRKNGHAGKTKTENSTTVSRLTKTSSSRTTYTIVAGQSDAISKDCIAVPSGEEVPELVKCVGLDDSDYEVQCVCHQGSGCNKAADNARDIFKPTNSNEDEARIVNELNKSIRQLRADLKRTLERYTAKYNTPQAPPPPTTSQTVD